MQIGRVNIGLWQYPKDSPWKWYQRWFEVSRHNGICGCVIYTFGLVCVTVMYGECWDHYLGQKGRE